MLAYGERRPNTRKEAQKDGQRFGRLSGVKLVSISPVRVWVALVGVCGAFGIMTKYTKKELRRLVKIGAAVDVTNANRREAIPEDYRQIGYSCGEYGCNGMLLQGCESGTLYAVTDRTTAIYIF